jgi:hypothetical protein
MANVVIKPTLAEARTAMGPWGDALVTSTASVGSATPTARSLADRASDVVNVKDFGAIGGGGATDDSGAIQDAIDTGKTVFFPAGVYSAGGLTQAGQRQAIIGHGVTIKKNSSGPVLTVGGRGAVIDGIFFDGSVLTYTGDCLKINADNVTLLNCGAFSRLGFGVECNGSNTRIIGTCEAYNSADPSGYGVCIGHVSDSTNYHQIIGITQSGSVGGVLFRNTSGSIVSSTVGKITNPSGYISCTRIAGDVENIDSFCQLDQCTITGDVTVGDGVNAKSGIGIGSNVFLQAGSTVTLNPNVRDSSICVSQLSGSVVVDNLSGTANDIGNNIHTPTKAYTPVWSASTPPALGDGSIAGAYTRKGRSVMVSIELLIGSTTTLGSGAYTFSLPCVVGGAIAVIGCGFVTDASGTNTAVVSYVAPGTKICYVIAPGGNVSGTVPITLAAGDVIRLNFEYVTA